MARSIGAGDIRTELEQLFDRYGRPQPLRSDNGREFIAASLGDWLAAQGVKTAFIEKGSPQQNPFVERFNGSMRDELLNGEEFDSLLEARVVIRNWIDEYNCLRPLPWPRPDDTSRLRRRLQSGKQMRVTTHTPPGPVHPTRPPSYPSSLTGRYRLGTLNRNGPNPGAGQNRSCRAPTAKRQRVVGMPVERLRRVAETRRRNGWLRQRCSYVKVGLAFRVLKTVRARSRLRQRMASRRLLPSACLRAR